MPGEIPVETEVEIENGTQEVAAEVRQEVVADLKQVAAEFTPEVAVELKPAVVAELKQEAAPEVRQEAAELRQEATELRQEEVTELRQEEVADLRQEEVADLRQEEVTKLRQKVFEVKQEEAPIQPSIQQNGAPKKTTMSTSMDIESVRAAYDDVRADNTDTQWAVFKFDGPRIVLSGKGAEFEKFRAQFTENERAFGYIRIQTGDEMSKRQKFLFITWVGPSVSVLQRAKMSTDKSVMKNVISNFAVELQIENTSEIDLGHFVGELNKAGGANYGTGIREI